VIAAIARLAAICDGARVLTAHPQASRLSSLPESTRISLLPKPYGFVVVGTLTFAAPLHQLVPEGFSRGRRCRSVVFR
jgi:hypothetical protein